ncbi:hypothetical protein [Polyangium mundeleinium]|uniref:Uncharacterized protein n=1 Tax=Polyangium mundeleinium TaxID=2995306 RepID=A0ABT5EJC1_9BACT|nr:hypothetical protein [Polyangium mundeleinium]MDC0741876.1 hypothetical protein [Polyangium mundeleinium]
MKVISPLLGFNNNVKHKGRVFHIQTEDSGHRHPHVITHLFADGGRILKTLKTSYAEHLNEANVQETVRQLMKDQHKAMFVALRDGQFDHIFEDKAETAAPAPAPAPAAAAPAPAPAPPAPEPAAPPPSYNPALPQRPSVLMNAADLQAALRGKPPASQAAVPSSAEIDMQLAALEQQTKAPETPAFVQQTQDVPPPPASIKKGGALFTAGVYRALGTPEPASASSPSSAGRYAQTRPPAIFATARPAQGTSIFGEDLISEKSLDEVILSYLAEDLEGGESP